MICRLPSILAGVLAFALVLAPPTASVAQEASQAQRCASDYEGPRRVVMEHEGRPGIWIAEQVMNCMVRDLRELPLARERITLLEEHLHLTGERSDALERAIQISQAIEGELSEALDRAVSGRSESEMRARAWYRSPLFLVSIGAAVAAGLVALAAWTLQEISSKE